MTESKISVIEVPTNKFVKWNSVMNITQLVKGTTKFSRNFNLLFKAMSDELPRDSNGNLLTGQIGLAQLACLNYMKLCQHAVEMMEDTLGSKEMAAYMKLQELFQRQMKELGLSNHIHINFDDTESLINKLKGKTDD